LTSETIITDIALSIEKCVRQSREIARATR